MKSPATPVERKPVGARACPICGHPSNAATRPFCSPRCVDVDLHRWLAGRYVIPGEPAAEAETDEPG